MPDVSETLAETGARSCWCLMARPITGASRTVRLNLMVARVVETGCRWSI
jgi:hypothetical protein